MAKIIGFNGVRYNQSKIKMKNVCAPPYDVISPLHQDELYKRDKFNIIRLILGKEQNGDTEKNNKYTRAGEYFRDWQTKNILTQDNKPCIYVYKQDFVVDKKKYSRVGFISLLKLEPFFKGTVYPHEKTLSKPKQDRLNVMRACKTNFSQIFGLYDDKSKKIVSVINKICKRKPEIDLLDESKERNRIWVVSDEKEVNNIIKNMADKKIFIADGHHRYETALNFSKEMKKKQYGYVMTFFCDMNDSGLIVFPTHRLVKSDNINKKDFIQKIEQYFYVEKISSKNMSSKLYKEYLKKNTAFCLYIEKELYLLVLKNKAILQKFIKGSKAYRELDVTVLEYIIFKNILKFSTQDILEQKYLKYVKDLNETLKLVNDKKFTMAFIMNPTRVNQIKEVALNNETMPQKSTYFYPKLLTGLVINKFE